MQPSPKNMRLHIGLFGRRNVGKSSLLNAITKQEVSIVSTTAGTTTDPVEKPMELLPLGPVLFIDTAGIDDIGSLGEKRISKTRQVIDRTEIGIVVTDNIGLGKFENQIIDELLDKKIPIIVVFNKSDLGEPSNTFYDYLNSKKIKFITTSLLNNKVILDLKQALLETIPPEFLKENDLTGDLIKSGEMSILVIPIDKEAPKGRLILPQVQTIRNILDNNATTLIVKENELKNSLNLLKIPPKIVITDSQAFSEVAKNTPKNILMTSFSILFARLQGDLTEMVRGAITIDNLKNGDKILIAEACSHHPITDDIGRVKIPKWLTEYTGKNLNFANIQGHDFPEDLESYSLVIHCGACMWNKKEMLSRMMKCKDLNVPLTNYGLTIAFSLNIFERALQPFPQALKAYKEQKRIDNFLKET